MEESQALALKCELFHALLEELEHEDCSDADATIALIDSLEASISEMITLDRQLSEEEQTRFRQETAPYAQRLKEAYTKVFHAINAYSIAYQEQMQQMQKKQQIADEYLSPRAWSLFVERKL